jgi:hypothetical protein
MSLARRSPRSSLTDEHGGEQALRHALRKRRRTGARFDRAAEPASAGTALRRQARARASKLVERHEVAAQSCVDVGIEHDRSQRASEVEERASHRRARDAVDLVQVLVVDDEALVHDEAVVARAMPAEAQDLDEAVASGRQTQQRSGRAV